MTPMIDVVFQLIIFFLLSNHWAQREQRIKVDLPTAQSGQRAVTQDRPRVTLTLETGGRLWWAGQAANVESLAGRLRAEQQLHSEPIELRIRCDRHVPYRDVEPLLGAAVEAGIVKVSVAVVEAAGK